MRRPGAHVREEEGDDAVAWEAESRLKEAEDQTSDWTD